MKKTMVTPWNKIGISIRGVSSWSAAVKRTNLMWSVSKRQLCSFQNNKKVPTTAWGVFRDDTDDFLETVEAKTDILQNSSAFNFVDEFLKKIPGAEYDTAGSLFEGKCIFVILKLPYTIKLAPPPHELLHCYLMFQTTHDGSMRHMRHLKNSAKLMLVSLSGAILPLTISINGTGISVIKQIESIHRKLNALFQKSIDDEMFDIIMKKIFGKNCYDSSKKKNQIELIKKWFDESSEKNAYTLLVTYLIWIDQYRTTRKTKRMANLNDHQIQIQSSIFYDGAVKKEKAFFKLIKLLNN